MFALSDKLKVLGLSGAILLMLPIILWLAFGKAGWERKAHKAEAQVVQTTQKLAACEARAESLSGALNLQNEAVARLKATSDAKVKTAQDAARKAQAETQKYRSRVERIAKAKAGPDQCLSAKELIVETLRDDRQH